MSHLPLFSPSPGIKYIVGPRQTLVINFRTGVVETIDSKSGMMIFFMEKGYSVPDISSTLRIPIMEVESRLEDLTNKAIIGPPSKVEKENEEEISPNLNYLWLEVTNRCNLNCIHCYARASKGGKPINSDLTYATIMKAIHDGADLGCLYIQFTGGEPTLRKDLKKLILGAKDSGITQIEVFSNGVSISEPLIDFFTREEIQLAISFYSHREKVHDSITGVKGSQRRTLKNLKIMAAKGIQMRCEMILMKENRNDFPATHEMLREIGIHLYRSHPILPIGRGGNTVIDSNWDAYSEIMGGPPFGARIWDFEKKRKWNSCWYGKAAVAFNGDVLPCIFAREQVVGNVKHEGLASIIKGKMLSYWGINKDKVDVCRECEYRYNCDDCPPLTYSLTGSLTSKPPYCRYDPYSGILKEG